MKYPRLGSISSGTLRDDDLLSAFAAELDYQAERNRPYDQFAAHKELVAEAEVFDPENPDNECDAGDIIAKLEDALQEFAPPYCYFGSLEGDGADFGFWLSDDALNDFDGLRVDDASEVPADYVGEVLHTNDHGNITLYAADHGKLTEIWAIV